MSISHIRIWLWYTFINPLMTVLRAPIIIGIIVTFMFHSFFNSLERSRYLSFSLSVNFTLWSTGTAQQSRQFCKFLFFFLVDYYKIWQRLGDPFLCQNPKGVCACPSPGQMLGCAFTICSYGQIVDHFAHPVMSILILILWQFARFADYVIDGFVYHHTTHIRCFVASYQFLL